MRVAKGFKMNIKEADLRAIIKEELKAFKNRKNVANSKHPSDVEPVEDPNANGILSDDFEHVPEDVPADVEKPQARVQDLTPIVKERRYSLRSLLEQDSPKLSAEAMKKAVSAWSDWFSKKMKVRTDEGDRQAFLIRVVEKLGPNPDTATQIKNMDTALEIQDDMGMNNTGYDLDDLISALGALPAQVAYRKKTTVTFDDDAVGGRDSAGEVDINEARFVGGFGFGKPSLSESEEIEEGCGCGDPSLPDMHMSSAHDVIELDIEERGRDLDHSDHEGSMARSQLRRAAKYSQKLGHMIRETDDLPEWLGSKITKASDYLGSVYHYLDYEINGKK